VSLLFVLLKLHTINYLIIFSTYIFLKLNFSRFFSDETKFIATFCTRTFNHAVVLERISRQFAFKNRISHGPTNATRRGRNKLDAHRLLREAIRCGVREHRGESPNAGAKVVDGRKNNKLSWL
jgi:hypothetical protein